MGKLKYILTLSLWFLGSTLFAVLSEDHQSQIIPRENNVIKNRECDVAIAALFQNEAPFLKEWIEFHRMMGVKHFYLYNNLSTDDFEKVLKPYVERGIVELFDVPIELYNGPFYLEWQVAIYNHALALSRNVNKWVAFIDIDEFICIVPSEEKKFSRKNKNYLYNFLKQYEYAGGLALNWVMYGTSNVYEIGQKELLIEKLTKRYPLSWGENGLIKSIVRPEYVENCIDAHTFKYQGDIFCVHPNHQKFSHTQQFEAFPVDQIRLNHYWYRTEKFFWEIKIPRRAVWGEKRSAEDIKSKLNLANSEEDASMKKYVAPLKRKMFR